MNRKIYEPVREFERQTSYCPLYLAWQIVNEARGYLVIGVFACLIAGCAEPVAQTAPITNPAPIIKSSATTELKPVPASPKNESDYIKAVVESVRNRWYHVLDSKQFPEQKKGKVVVHFRIHPDGSVSDVTITDNSTGEMLGSICEQVIKDCAPFPKWPADMLKMKGEAYSDSKFTFYYQ